MKDNIYFWVTIISSAIVLVGLSILALHSSPALYQNFLRLCGVNAASCTRIIETISPPSVMSIVVLIWVAVVFLWQTTSTQIFIYQKSRISYPLPNTLRVIALRHRIQNRLIIIPGNSLFCAGIIKRRIYIGRNLLRELTRPEIEAALVHESYHLKGSDPLKILLVNTFSKSFFFLPAIREMAQAYLREKEISADRVAESAVGRKYLSRALVKAFSHESDHSLGFAGLTSARNSSTFSTWGWGLTVLLIGIGWIAIKSSLAHGGCS